MPNDSEISSVDDLKGKRIGVQIYTTGMIYASEIEDVTIESFANASQAVDELKAGELDAVVVDGEPAKIFAERDSELKLIDEPLTEEEYAIGVAKGNTALLKKINKSIEKLKASGKYDSIREEYISAE